MADRVLTAFVATMLVLVVVNGVLISWADEPRTRRWLIRLSAWFCPIAVLTTAVVLIFRLWRWALR